MPLENSPEGCLFGQALMALGVAEHELRDWEVNEWNSSDTHAGTIRMLLPHLGIAAPQHILRLLRQAQSAQDVGKAWGSDMVMYPLRQAKQQLS